MKDIDDRIDEAKRKPMSYDNLNAIGDLYMKKGDIKRAVAYFFESADKLHYAQKDKKLATFKKIINISPSSEKAYIGIIEILSKMGLVMEEKRYLHMLAELYQSKGDPDRAEELLEKIRELDPHVVINGTFFHDEVRKEIFSEQPQTSVSGTVRDIAGSDKKSVMTDTDYSDYGASKNKLIEASLDEIPVQRLGIFERLSASRYRYMIIASGIIAVSVIVASVLYVAAGRFFIKSGSGYVKPITIRTNNYEISVSRTDNPVLSGESGEKKPDNEDLYLLTVSNPQDCLPEAFATDPHEMISLFDNKGALHAARKDEWLKKTTRLIAKMNVCGRENGIVHLKTYIAVDRRNQYSGIAISSLQDGPPVRVEWSAR